MSYPQSISLSPLELLERAEAFLAYQKASPSKPRYFLLCHSIRLVLRAYIASRRSLAENELRRTFGHDLLKLLGEASRLGLAISQSAENEIEKLTEAYVKYFTCYPKQVANRVLVIEHFVSQHVEELFEAVRSKIVLQ
jgi:HEPN domain-containing protein